MTANINTASYKSTNIGTGLLTAVTKRTLGDRAGDVYNVKDGFGGVAGALGNGTGNDAPAIQAAVNAMMANGGGTIFFPPGVYPVASTIDCKIPFGLSVEPGIGRMQGSGAHATRITGILNYVSGTGDQGYILDKGEVTPSVVGDLCDISIENLSTVLGTGAVRWSGQNTVLRNVSLIGMCCLDASSNNFATVAYNLVTASPAAGSGRPLGSVGVSGNMCVFGFRTNGGHETCFLMSDGPHHLDMLGIEECTIGLHLGVHMTAAMECSLSGTTLTIGGPTGSLHPEPQQGYANLGANLINPGPTCFIVANNIPYGVSVNVVSQLTNTEPGGAPSARGTYHCVITGGSASFTTQPILIRQTIGTYASTYTNIQTEGDLRAIVVQAAGNCTISNVILTGAVNEGATTQGTGVVDGSNQSTIQNGIYIANASNTSFENISINANVAQGGIVFDPTFNTDGGLTFVNCGVAGATISGTDTGAFIDNGAGAGTYNGAAPGHILTIKALTGAGSAGRGTYLSGPGLPTGASRYVIKDGVTGWTPGSGVNKQFTLMKPDGTTIANTTYAPGNAIAFNFGAAWGVSDTSLLYPIPNSIGIGQVTNYDLFTLQNKERLQFVNSNNPPILLGFSQLPAVGHVSIGAPNIGVEFLLSDSPVTTFYASPAPGGGSNVARVRCVETAYFVATLSNGSGGAGDILNVTSFSSGAGVHISPGMNINDFGLGNSFNAFSNPCVVQAYGTGGTGGAGSTGTYKLVGSDLPKLLNVPWKIVGVLWAVV